ncbi:MAG TPA: hypothetical protein VFQ39_19095 [Longimicrobium sp.]|nr:hypothetical protein [Longimicrobium sp.]
MKKNLAAGEPPADEETGVVGIVVQNGAREPARPHLAFSWGPEVLPAPSLPFRRLAALAARAA